MGRKKRSPDELDVVLLTRVSHAAKLKLEEGARAQAISVAAHVRQVLYRHLGLIKGDLNHG